MRSYFFVVAWIIALAVVPSLWAGEYKRMIILIDEKTELTPPGKQAALAQTLAINLHQKAAPILAPVAVVHAYLMRKYGGFHQNEKTDGFFARIQFNPNDWLIYRCKNTPLFLFVPKTMEWVVQLEEIKITKKTDTETIEKTILLPILKAEALEQFVAMTGNVIQDLMTWVSLSSINKVTAEHFESLFFNNDDLQKKLQNDQALKNAVKLLFGDDDEKIGEKINALRALIKPWNIFLQGHGSYASGKYVAAIADLKQREFEKVLLLFNKINTHFLAISSCYAGGKNLDFIRFKKDLDKKQVSRELSYIVAILSSSDSPSTSATPIKIQTMTIGSVSTTTMTIDFSIGMDLKSFFTSLELQSEPHWMAGALKHLVKSFQKISAENVPQILVPHAGWFQAFIPKSEASVLLIGNVLVKKHEIEKNVLEIKDRNVVVIYPDIIPIPLKISSANVSIPGQPINLKFPIMLSMKPGDSTHVFSSIEVVGGLKKFMENSFFELKGRRTKKTFLIKTLQGTNDFEWLSAASPLALQDVVIKSWSDQNKDVHYVYWFKCGDNYYKRFYDGSLLVDTSGNPLPLPFQGGQITQQDYMQETANAYPFFDTLETYVTEKPEWTRVIPSKPTMKKGDVEHQIIRLETKLETLTLTLKKLRDCLQQLSRTFQGTSIPSVPVSKMSQALIDCHKLLNGWIRGSLESIDNQMLQLAEYFVHLDTDAKWKFFVLLVQKLDPDARRVLFGAVIKCVNTNAGNSSDVRMELAALSIQLYAGLHDFYGVEDEPTKLRNAQLTWEAAQSGSINLWMSAIIKYYETIKKQGVVQIKGNKSKHFFVTQLCVFFSHVTYTNMYQQVYNWMASVFPVLDMNDFSRVRFLIQIVRMKTVTGVNPEFVSLVDTLLDLELSKKAIEHVKDNQINELSDSEKFIFENYIATH